MNEIEQRLRELIDRHTQPDPRIGGEIVEYTVAVAELRNIIEPGSAPMYPSELLWSATCETCMPEGDGRSFRRGKR